MQIQFLNSITWTVGGTHRTMWQSCTFVVELAFQKKKKRKFPPAAARWCGCKCQRGLERRDALEVWLVF